MAFKVIRTDDADLTRVQQNVQQAFAEVANVSAGVVEYIASGGPLVRKVVPAERYILANSRGGSVRVVLPAPAGGQVVSVTNITDSANPVQIVTDDGTTFTSGAASVPVPANQTREVATAGRAWSPL